MRRIDLKTPLPASAERAWEVLTDTAAWPGWGGLVTSASGSMEPGATWTMCLRAEPGGPPRRMRPRLVSVDPPRCIAFQTRLGLGAVAILHTFTLEALAPDRAVLHQAFEIRGPLVRPLWRLVRAGVVQFDELGDDLARRLDGEV